MNVYVYLSYWLKKDHTWSQITSRPHFFNRQIFLVWDLGLFFSVRFLLDVVFSVSMDIFKLKLRITIT